MAIVDLIDWLEEFSSIDYVWYLKRLSGNDTLANGSHQAGPYIQKDFLLSIFPELNDSNKQNPDKWFDLYIDSHSDYKKVRVVWYNNKFHGGTRNEARITNFGGYSSALLDPESTGALTIFAFKLDENSSAVECRVWVSRHGIEEDLIEDRLGPVEPGKWLIWSAEDNKISDKQKLIKQPCKLSLEEIPAEWLIKFPPGIEIINKSVELRPNKEISPDKRLLMRRVCEFEIYCSVEEAIELPLIKEGFNTINDFITRAQTILQRRKARSGRSLELQLRQILLEECFLENNDFSYQPESEKGKKPDFIFPSESAYKNKDYPQNKLKMLAVKTTCRDRWRQILNEAKRIKEKHLLTLQEGISENQFKEITESGVKLVIPEPLIESFPKSVRPHLLTLESFLGEVRHLNLHK